MNFKRRNLISELLILQITEFFPSLIKKLQLSKRANYLQKNIYNTLTEPTLHSKYLKTHACTLTNSKRPHYHPKKPSPSYIRILKPHLRFLSFLSPSHHLLRAASALHNLPGRTRKTSQLAQKSHTRAHHISLAIKQQQRRSRWWEGESVAI